MGLFSKLLSVSNVVNILVVGLSGAAKETIMKKFIGKIYREKSLHGFDVLVSHYKNIKFIILDVDKLHNSVSIWKYYMDNIQGLVYVVEKNSEYLDKCHEYIHKMLTWTNVPLLVLVNGTDRNPKNIINITKEFQLLKINKIKWHVQGCCGKSGDGLYEGFGWLAHTISNPKYEYISVSRFFK